MSILTLLRFCSEQGAGGARPRRAASSVQSRGVCGLPRHSQVLQRGGVRPCWGSTAVAGLFVTALAATTAAAVRRSCTSRCLLFCGTCVLAVNRRPTTCKLLVCLHERHCHANGHQSGAHLYNPPMVAVRHSSAYICSHKGRRTR